MDIKTILLVEDDFLNRRLTKKVLSENGFQVLEAKNAQEALELLKMEKVSLTILDINLGENELDGITIGDELQRKYSIPFIYLTAYDADTIVKKAVTTNPYAYLTKPLKRIDLITTVQLAIKKYAGSIVHKGSIRVKQDSYHIELPLEDIDYIEAEGNYLLFYANDKVYKVRSSIKQILTELPSSIFLQTHRAFIVNKSKIDKFNLKQLIIKDIVIPVSKNYIDNINIVYGKQ